MATRSPLFTPRFDKALARLFTRSFSWLKAYLFPSKTMATLSGQIDVAILRKSVVFVFASGSF